MEGQVTRYRTVLAAEATMFLSYSYSLCTGIKGTISPKSGFSVFCCWLLFVSVSCGRKGRREGREGGRVKARGMDGLDKRSYCVCTAPDHNSYL